MGWFSDSKTDSNFQNIGWLCGKTSYDYCTNNYRQPDVRVVLVRLGHMVFRTMPDRWTTNGVMVAKWYLENIGLLRLSGRDRLLTENLCGLLQQNVDAFEHQYGEVDNSRIYRLVDLANLPSERVLIGFPISPERWAQTTNTGTPIYELSRYIASAWVEPNHGPLGWGT